jgi:hypothetical protein
MRRRARRVDIPAHSLHFSLCIQNFRDPRRNEAVNKRNLSTGENGEFGAEGGDRGAQRQVASAANAFRRRVAGNRTSAECLG